MQLLGNHLSGHEACEVELAHSLAEPLVKIFFKSSLMPFCPGFHVAGHASPYSLTYCKGTEKRRSEESGWEC